MKKLSLLLAAALCVTIGGVYATWHYAQANSSSVDTTLSAELAGIVTEGEKGEIVVSERNVKILIDDTNSDYKAELIIENPLLVSFTPAAGVDADVAANGVKLQITIKETFGSYDHDGDSSTDDIDIFYIGAAGQTEATFDLNGGNPVKEQISVNLAEYIKMNAISLPTKAYYDRLDTILKDTTNHGFEIIISEVATTPTV